MKTKQLKPGQTVILGGDVATVLKILPGGRVLVETNANGEEETHSSKLTECNPGPAPFGPWDGPQFGY